MDHDHRSTEGGARQMCTVDRSGAFGVPALGAAPLVALVGAIGLGLGRRR